MVVKFNGKYIHKINVCLVPYIDPLHIYTQTYTFMQNAD